MGTQYPNSLFLLLWGMWGKAAISSFILISGWFLCNSNLSWQRVFKLWFQIKFYQILIFIILLFVGYETFTWGSVKYICLSNLISVNNGFTASFMAFYIFVPFYNKLIKSMNKRSHGWLVVGLLLYFSVASTLLCANSMNEPFWYMTLYFIASYLRLYPIKWCESLRCSWGCLV